MTIFDLHDKYARCRGKLIREDDCVKDRPCSICDSFAEVQRECLATPTNRIRKEKKSGLLVTPKEVSVLAPVNDNEPTFQSPAGPSVQPAEHSTPQGPSTSFVTSGQFLAMSDKWAEQFVRMEALLSRGNVFSTPKSSVSKVLSQDLISNTPFLAPSARPTGPVETPAVQEVHNNKPKKNDNKDKKKSHKSRKDKDKDVKHSKKRDSTDSLVQYKATTGSESLFIHRLEATLDWSWSSSLV